MRYLVLPRFLFCAFGYLSFVEVDLMHVHNNIIIINATSSSLIDVHNLCTVCNKMPSGARQSFVVYVRLELNILRVFSVE